MTEPGEAELLERWSRCRTIVNGLITRSMDGGDLGQPELVTVTALLVVALSYAREESIDDTLKGVGQLAEQFRHVLKLSD